MFDKFLVCFLSLVLLSCSKNSSKIEEIEIKDIVKLSDHVVKEIRPNCYKDGILKDSLLILFEECGENLFQIYDINSYQLVKKFGKRGRGPLEFIYPVFMNDVNQPNILSIHDLSHFKVHRIDLKTDTLRYLQSFQLPRKLIHTFNLNI